MRTTTRLIVVLAILAGSGQLTAAGKSSAPMPPTCSRDCLIDTMNLYLDTMIVRKDFRSLKVTPNLRITENGTAIAPGEGRAASYGVSTW